MGWMEKEDTGYMDRIEYTMDGTEARDLPWFKRQRCQCNCGHASWNRNRRSRRLVRCVVYWFIL
jgi:hypothetical protein